MQEFEIRLRSVQDVQDFVAIATELPFPIFVGNSRHKVDAKCFMEMFCLDFSFPVTARAECSREEFEAFRRDADRFAVK